MQNKALTDAFLKSGHDYNLEKPAKHSALSLYLDAHGDDLPPKVLKNALTGKKPRAKADPNDDTLNRVSTGNRHYLSSKC